MGHTARLVAGIDKRHAISLISKCMRCVEYLPPTILTLVAISRRADPRCTARTRCRRRGRCWSASGGRCQRRCRCWDRRRRRRGRGRRCRIRTRTLKYLCCGGQAVCGASSAGGQNMSIEEQGCRMSIARQVHRAGDRPRICRCVIDLGCGNHRIVAITAGHEYPAIR